MIRVMICIAVWFIVWMLWYRIEWKTEVRDNPKFTTEDRYHIFLGSMTWPFQLIIFFIGTPIYLARRAFGWKPKEDDEESDES